MLIKYKVFRLRDIRSLNKYWDWIPKELVYDPLGEHYRSQAKCHPENTFCSPTSWHLFMFPTDVRNIQSLNPPLPQLSNLYIYIYTKKFILFNC